MAGRKLAVNTTAVDEDGRMVTFEAGTTVSERVAEGITNPKAWAKPGKAAEDSDDPSDADGAVEPPRAGRGSGVEAWTAYAVSLGLEVSDGASRDEVIELVDQHNAHAS